MTLSPPLHIAQISMHTDPLDDLGGDVTGGMNVYIRELARALPAHGVRADVFTRLESDGAPRVVPIAPGARLIRIPAGEPRPLDKNDLLPIVEEFTAGIMAFSAQERAHYDLLSAHYWLSGLAGAKIAREWSIPLFLRFHTLAALKDRVLRLDQKEPEARREAEARLARQSDALLVSSLDEAELLTREFGASPERVHFVPCGVDTGRFSPLPRESARAQLGLDAETPLILSVGRVDPIKGLDRLVDALRLMKKE
ncbi:MAG: glycosyltransferase, partial [bacterium]|nr:glycosyltransferase [bacterium]